MVRGNLRLWLGIAGFTVLVATLALIAANRDRGTELDGRWDLVLVETPGFSAEPEGPSWVEFDQGFVAAATNCFQMDGQYSVGGGAFRMDEWGSSLSCPDPVGEAYSNFLWEISEIRLSDGNLILQNGDASVQFTYRRESG